MTLRDLDEAGKDVRAWCFECARGERVDTMIWAKFAERHWPMELDAAARQFRCSRCSSSEHVGLFPATRPEYPPMTANDFAAALFFGAKAAAKTGKRDTVHDRATAIIEAGWAQRNAPKRAMPPAPVLRLVWSKPDV